MNEKTNVLRSQFVAALVKDGWVEDKFGHFKFNTTENEYHIKMQVFSFRLEVQRTTPATAYSKAENHWVKIDGAYYNAVKDLGNGRIKAGRRIYGTGTINYLTTEHQSFANREPRVCAFYGRDRGESGVDSIIFEDD